MRRVGRRFSMLCRRKFTARDSSSLSQYIVALGDTRFAGSANQPVTAVYNEGSIQNKYRAVADLLSNSSLACRFKFTG
jgi:hypothetical protein